MENDNTLTSPYEAMLRADRAITNGNWDEANAWSRFASALTNVARWQDAMATHKVALAAEHFVAEPNETGFAALVDALIDWKSQLQTPNA